MLEQLKIYFIEECNTSTLDFKYKSYPDLSGMTNDQLWFHANEYGYKEQRQIFHDCYYNSLFYDYYLADYRKIVLYHNPYFDWKIYKPTSEYDALIHYINQCDLSYNDVLTDVSYTNPHYSIVAECPSYDYQKFPFAYGAGQWSSGFFGLIVPCKSILKRVYFMYLYDSYDEYEVSENLDKYVFNSSSVRIKLDLYINGSMSDYYVEETLDASKNMLGALFKKKNINGPTINVDYDEIILEENSVISWFCSDLLSQTTNHEFINNPYNPARNRFIMILEPYNTRYVSNPNIDLGTINSDIKMNQYNISLKQNKLNSGNNIQIVDNIISVVGLSGVESNFYYVNQLRNDVESSFVEINDLITNITIDNNLSNSIYDLSSSIEALYLDVSNINMTKQPTINEGDLLISDTSGLELALDGKQDTISFLSDICLNDLHVHGNTNITGNLRLGSIPDVEDAINNAGGVPSITYDAETEITTFDGSFVVIPQLTIEDDLSMGGDLFVNGGIYTDNFSVSDTTGHTTIGNTNITDNLRLGLIANVEDAINNAGGVPSITYDPVTEITTFDGSFVVIPQLTITPDVVGDANQEIYSKSGTTTLKLGDNDGMTTTFSNILKSENGNATFYGKDEMKYMEYNSTDDIINLSKDMDLGINNLTLNKGVIQEVIGTSPSAVGGGSLTLIHDNNGGTSSIVFKSKNESNNDFGYISYIDDYEGRTTEQMSLLEIAAKDDKNISRRDNIALMPSGFVGINTRTPQVMLDVSGDIICNGNLKLNTIPDVEQQIIELYNLNTTKQQIINEGDLLISNISGLELTLSNKQDTISFLSDICLNDLHVHGNIIIDGSFNFSEVIQNITTVNNEVVFSTQLDVSNQGTGPALKVSQFGVGDDQDVALFNAGLEGDALKIDSCGNSHFYKHVNVSGTMTSNSPWALLGQTIDGDSFSDESGYSVSINAKGDIVAIGARYDDNSGNDSGSTKMYQYIDGSWNQLGQTIDGDSDYDRSGWSVSINAKGDIVAIGAPYYDNSGNDSGSTKMYQYTNGSWNQLGQTIDGDSIGDESGTSVSINAKGDIVAIGARYDDNSGINSGSTKMYQYIDGSWNQLGQTIYGDSIGDYSGWSVSINAKGDIVAIGAILDDNSGNDSGSTKMYQYIDGSWNQLGQTIDGDSFSDESGYSVSINAKGDIVAIGAILDDNSGNDSGSTKMYQYIDGSWNQLGQTIYGDSIGDYSGWSVSINAKGDIVAIGARYDDNSGNDSGSTKMYQYIDGSWNQLGQTIDGDSSKDYSGHSVSINAKGDIVAIGALYDDNNDTINSGSTKIYQKGLRGNVTIEDDMNVGGDLNVNGGIYTDNFSVADTTGHTTIGGTLSVNESLDISNNLNVNGNTNITGNLQLGLIANVEDAINNAGGVPSITYNAETEITTFDSSFVVMHQLTIEDDLSMGGDLRVNGDLVVDGTFNFSEIIQNITTVNNEVVFSTQLDVSNQGTGPALKVSQFGVGDDQDVALFNAGLEGDAFKIDSCGNSHFYKHVNVSGTMTSNSPWALLGQTIDGDSSDDRSGGSVSINAKGDIVAIGAPNDDNSGNNSGSTQMYQYTNGSWNQLGQTIDGDSGGDQSGQPVSINAKGDIVAIGAHLDDNSGNNSGSTKMYQYIDGSWNQLGQTIDGDSGGDQSGYSVSINAKGDIVAIGAPRDDNRGKIDSGSTKMYQYTNGTWNQLGQTINGDSIGDYSGWSVSINAKGDIVAIGARYDDNNDTINSGSTKMYQYIDGSWNQLGQTIDGDSDGDRSGFSVSINAKGDIVAIGAILDDNNGNSNSGSTKMYQYIDGSWNQLGQTIDGDSFSDESGYSVSINAKGDIVAIGARLDDNSGDDSGSTKMYQYIDGSWNQLGQTIDGDSVDDYSGYSVSINAKGDIVAIGSLYDDNSGNDSGSTKIYQKGLRGNVTIEDDMNVGGDLIVNGGIYTDNFSVADTTGHTTIGGDIICNGNINSNEVKVNSIPLNSFTNYKIGSNYDFGTWGGGNQIIYQEIPPVKPVTSHGILQFDKTTDNKSFTCLEMGTYEITACVIFRNTAAERQNPCIAIGIDNDTNDIYGTVIGPNWDFTPYNQTPFAVSYVRMEEGKVCSLTAKRIHHFTNATNKVEVKTYIETIDGDEFQDTLTTYTILSATIQFKYIGKFDSIS